METNYDQYDEAIEEVRKYFPAGVTIGPGTHRLFTITSSLLNIIIR
jgi:hypothetical protein